MGKRGSKHVRRDASLKALAQDEPLFKSYITEVFKEEVGLTESMQTLLRGESHASKMMNQLFKIFGAKYLKKTLESHIKKAISSSVSYEIDPSRIEENGDIKANQQNLEKLTKGILESILKSLPNFPGPIRNMCICLRKVLTDKYPDSDMNIKAVGTVIFLRFINPALVTPVECDVVGSQPPPKAMRGLLLASKILQNIANNVEFSKEQHMLVFNDFVRAQFGPMRAWVTELSTRPPNPLEESSTSGVFSRGEASTSGTQR